MNGTAHIKRKFVCLVCLFLEEGLDLHGISFVAILFTVAYIRFLQKRRKVKASFKATTEREKKTFLFFPIKKKETHTRCHIVDINWCKKKRSLKINTRTQQKKEKKRRKKNES